MSEHTFKSLKASILSLLLTTKFYLSLCSTLQNTFKAFKNSFSNLSATSYPSNPISPLPLLKTFKSKQDLSSRALKIISHYTGLFLSTSISLNSCIKQIKLEKSLYNFHKKSAPDSLNQAEKAFKTLISSVKNQEVNLTRLIENFISEFAKIDSPLLPPPHSIAPSKPKINEKSFRSSSVSTLKKFY